MLPGQHRKVRYLFGLADVALIALAFQLAYWTRTRLSLANEFFLDARVTALLLGWSMVVWVTLAAWFETYDRIDATHPRIILHDAFRQCLLGAIAVVLFDFALNLDLSRPFVGLFAAWMWVLVCLFRLNGGRLLGLVRREFTQPHFVMVVGIGPSALRLAQQIEDAHGVRLSGFFSDYVDGAPEGSLTQVELGHSYPVYPISALPEMLREHVIDDIVFATDRRRLADLEDIILLCDEEGVRTHVAADFFPHVNSRVHLERLGRTPLLTFSATPHDEIRLLVKRVLDVILAGAALLLLFPVMLMIALLIRLTSPGPVIFRQERCGLNGRRFMFYKFRSMCDNAHAMREQVSHMSERSLAWKIPNDPRLTSVGRWLRKFSIDEWPQLWNVLRGDMSLVGPRPAIPEEVEQYARWQRRRLRMRPGLTCLWVINGRDRVDFETWMKLDMEYIDNWSLALDWKIILRTIPSVLTGRGAN